MMGFYARLITHHFRWAPPLHALKESPFSGTSARKRDTLKQALCEAPVLQPLDFIQYGIVLVTDASDVAVSAVLHHRVQGELAPISY
jgi:hypothetical protein